VKTLLVVVANGWRARIWAVRDGEIEELEALTHPESRAKGIDLESDRPGRAFDDAGGGQHRSAMEPPTDKREVEQNSFARTLARKVSIHTRKGRFPQVLLMAPPRFLGRLKAALEPPIARRVFTSVSHDYTMKTQSELLDVLRDLGVLVAPLPSPA
jgi:protein required for attachment to host cells